MLRVLADDHDAARALDDLALLAHGLYGRSHSPDVASLLQSGSALAAPGDAAAGQIVGRKLDGDLVAGIDADELHSNLSG